ncbi:glutathione S-transferase family protein [Lysobacter silvisoli]|uniref:Glutathione S-transferase family protein n=1 Tax=Lysobacter silvisoli TaxID=2293254 RepID=A0A371K2X7_9GAMM|nr:glutathione S-transferase family protein [Lysobacter silvisoli]RDZ28263.1 glutathione S-transferase family protein [Lysobacter silvisoli]
MYALYYSPGAASLVVHWLLIELDAPHELRLTDIASGAHKTPEYLALNPEGRIPTLVVDDEPLCETAALLLLLGDRHPESGFAPAPTDPRRGAYYQWMLYLANAVQSPLRLWWYPSDLGAADPEAVRAAVRERVESAWQRIDAHLAAHGPYLLGEGPGIVDFYLTMLMRWTRNMPRPGHDWPHLAELARRMKARPSFRTLYEREGLTEWA